MRKTDRMDLIITLAQDMIEAEETLENEFPGQYRSAGFIVHTNSRGHISVECLCYVTDSKWYNKPSFKESMNALMGEMKPTK